MGGTRHIYTLSDWGNNSVSQIRLLSPGSGGYYNKVSELHQHSWVVIMSVIYILMSWPNIMMYRIYHVSKE